MKIEDIKQVYPEFKYFKTLYPLIKRSDTAYLAIKNGVLKVKFSRKTEFYILSATIEKTDTLFLKWIEKQNGKFIWIEESEAKAIKSAKKADVIAVYDEDDSFSFEWSEDGVVRNIRFTPNDDQTSLEGLCGGIEDFVSKGEIITLQGWDGNLDKEILNIYSTELGVVCERNDAGSFKLLEFPGKRILSAQKDGKNEIRFIRVGDYSYVSVDSYDDKTGFKISQLFITI